MCNHVNDPGGREAAMVVLERDDEGVATVFCDPCIAPVIKALNDGGVPTSASCCGHGHRPGWIMLLDGRVLTILPDLYEARRIGGLWPGINGEPAQLRLAPRSDPPPSVSISSSRECVSSVHSACGGYAWDVDADDWATCACTCHKETA